MRVGDCINILLMLIQVNGEIIIQNMLTNREAIMNKTRYDIKIKSY